MNAPIQQPNEAAAVRDWRWKTRWLFVGAGFLLLCHALRLVDRSVWEGLRAWITWLLVGLLPHGIFLLFPILTREYRGASRVPFPGLRRCLLESAIAIPVVIATLLAIGGVIYVASQVSPDVSFTPDAIDRIASSPDPQRVYWLLVFAFAIAPISEELFFRGFLYNAFRRRMPPALAVVLESLIFGFSHFFGATHAVVATGLGIVLTLHYKWRKTLVAPILVHAGINFIWAASMLALMAENAKQPVIGVFGSAEDSGCLVQEIVPNSAASKGGVEIGDVILAIDGEPVADFGELAGIVQSHWVGDAVTLTIDRNGSRINIEVTLKRRGSGTD